MKQFLFISILFLTFFLFAEIALEFDKIDHDFGSIEEINGIVSHTFEFTNTGTEDFEITRLQAG
jgi:hypothetical protein